MRIFLAATGRGMSREMRDDSFRKYKPRYVLETFFNGERSCLRAMQEVGNDNFLLDSGAFSYMNGQKVTLSQMEEYVDRYITFIVKYQVKHFIEIDVDNIFGIEKVEEWRRKMERAAGRQCIPVWHKGRGVDYWKRMCREYSYQKKTVAKGAPKGNRNSVGHGAPKGNQNHYVHGLYANPTMDMIPEDEMQRLCQMDFGDEETLIIDEIILLTSRERQLLESIQKYQDQKNGLSLDGVIRRTVESEGVKGSRAKQVETTTRTRDVFDVIQKLQAELTKVQKEKRQYLSELRILRAQKAQSPKEDNTHERILQEFDDEELRKFVKGEKA